MGWKTGERRQERGKRRELRDRLDMRRQRKEQLKTAQLTSDMFSRSTSTKELFRELGARTLFSAVLPPLLLLPFRVEGEGHRCKAERQRQNRVVRSPRKGGGGGQRARLNLNDECIRFY